AEFSGIGEEFDREAFRSGNAARPVGPAARAVGGARKPALVTYENFMIDCGGIDRAGAVKGRSAANQECGDTAHSERYVNKTDAHVDTHSRSGSIALHNSVD